MPRPKLNIPDAQIVRLNSLGYSLGYIAETFGCHPSTVANRLESMGIAPADTRRTFMEDVMRNMPADQIEWIYSYLGPHYQIKNLVIDLLTTAYIAQRDSK